MNPRKSWNRDELLLAINLYCKTQFGKIHVRNPEIIKLAKYLDRTPGSVSYKLSNFASIDPSLPRKGASNVSQCHKLKRTFDSNQNVFFWPLRSLRLCVNLYLSQRRGGAEILKFMTLKR